MPDSLPLALLAADWLRSPAALAVGLACVALVAFLLFLVLFEPGLAYRVEAPEAPLDSPAFLHQLGALADAQVHPDSRVEVLTDGPQFYDSELAAVAAAGRTVNAE